MGAQPSQVAEHRYPSGNVYSGSMLGSKRHGAGTLRWADGAVYEGDWREDEMHGSGRIKFPNQSEYQGAFSHNNPYGYGTLTTINGERLTGEWQFQGRSAGPSGPVGKYYFSGDVSDASARRHYSGPLTLHQMSGLVALPGMPDATAHVMPYADVVGADTSTPEGRKMLAEATPVGAPVGAVPQAKVVDPAGGSIAYGYQDPALNPRHPDDHAAYEVLDPRLWLNSLGVTAFGQPHNVNRAEQERIRAAQHAQQQQGPQQPPNVVMR